jgi:acyl carrier protein
VDKQLADKVLSALARHVKRQYRNAVRLDARLQADLGLDSLNVIRFVLELEKQFGLSIPWETPPEHEIRTVGDLVTFITYSDRPAAGPGD